MDNNLAKLLARLTALKNNIPPEKLILREYADEFNSILIGLEEISKDSLGDFVIPEDKINPRVTSFNMNTGEKKYSSDEYCKRNFLLMKIDGILGYFTLILQPHEVENKLGFHIEEQQKGESN